ncbi:MAG: prepilin-type N-terminal cleavage/methylation domain-containing protein [Actinomycetes bacterium]
MRLLISRARSDEGMTLVELIVAMVLISVLGAIVSAAVLMSHKQVRIADDEATGLSDTRVVLERLGRDIRVSRGVDTGATDSTLVLWIDYNSDYVRDASSQAEEIITWSVVDQGTGQFNTLRSTAGGQVQLQARTLVSDLAFCYLAAPSDDPADCLPTPLSATDAVNTRLVRVTLQYDSALGYGSDDRTNTFTERIRNVS